MKNSYCLRTIFFSEMCLRKPTVVIWYRVRHRFRLTRRDDFLGSILTTFESNSIFSSIENWLEPEIEPPSGNLSCPILWNARHQITMYKCSMKFFLQCGAFQFSLIKMFQWKECDRIEVGALWIDYDKLEWKKQEKKTFCTQWFSAFNLGGPLKI